MTRARLVITAAFLLLTSIGVARADCTSPAYPAGVYQYFSADNAWKFCNGSDWNDFICPTEGGGGGGSPVTIFLTSGTSWTVPSDWNSANNTIEVIGGGGQRPCCRGPRIHRRRLGAPGGVKRGEVWTASGGADYAGKPRPVVVVQDDRFDGTASITICAFTTDTPPERIGRSTPAAALEASSDAAALSARPP